MENLRTEQLKGITELTVSVGYLSRAIVDQDYESIEKWIKFLENDLQKVKYDCLKPEDIE